MSARQRKAARKRYNAEYQAMKREKAGATPAGEVPSGCQAMR